MSARVTVGQPLDTVRLQGAVDRVVARHEALRLSLVHHPGLRVPLQDVDEDRTVALGAQGEFSVIATDGSLELAASPLIADQEGMRLLLAEVATAYAGGVLADDEDRLRFLDISEWQLTEQDRLAEVAVPDTRTACRLMTPHGDDPQAEVTATISAAALTAVAAAAGAPYRACCSSRGCWRWRAPRRGTRQAARTTRTWSWRGGRTVARRPARPQCGRTARQLRTGAPGAPPAVRAETSAG